MIRNSRLVVALAYDRLCTFEFGIAVEVFALPRPELDVAWYQFAVASLDDGPIRAMGGIVMTNGDNRSLLEEAGTIIIPGWPDADERPSAELVQMLRVAYDEGARLVSICSGAFVFAEAGLLDGRRATTHWRYAEKLAERYPSVKVEPDVLYVDEGQIMTSAGSAAGLDLCLHIVRKDYGAEVANTVARRLVVSPHRDGGQAQYILAPIRRDHSESLASVMDWAQFRLHQPLSVGQLAAKASMSPRTFARGFRHETGTTPLRWLNRQRLSIAQVRLETTDESIEEIAESVGLGTAANLRQHFHQTLGTTPTTYRQQFCGR